MYSIKLKGPEFNNALKSLKGKYEFMKMGKKEAFGELALINDAPRSASILCLKDCNFAVLSKENCKFMLLNIVVNKALL